MKAYDITISPKGERAGWINASVVRVYADTAAKAISRARKDMRFVIGHDRHDGPLTYTAKRVVEDN